MISLDMLIQHIKTHLLRLLQILKWVSYIEQDFMNYDSAGYYFSKAAVSNPPKEYLDKAKSNNLLFVKYSKLRKEINRFDRQLYYTQNPEIFASDSSAYVADSLKFLKNYLAQKEMTGYLERC